MKTFIILAMAINVLLMTHSSSKEEKVDLKEPAQINNYVLTNSETNTDEQIEMVSTFQETYLKNTANKFENETSQYKSTIQLEDINLREFDQQSSIGKQKELHDFIKMRGSEEKYKVKENEPRIFPLFTTFKHLEPAMKVHDILIELSEKEAVNLYMMSEMFKTICSDGSDISSAKLNHAYCERIYDEYDPNREQRIEACKKIRSVDFSVDVPFFDQVHWKHMKMIMQYVNTKDGISPPDGSVYVKEVDTTTIYFGEDMQSLGNFDLNYVNNIWNNNKLDVGYVLSTAMYLEIKCLPQLMGARIAQDIRATQASADPQDWEALASTMLDQNLFLTN